MVWVKCYKCKHVWVVPDGSKLPKKCPKCGSGDIRLENGNHKYFKK